MMEGKKAVKTPRREYAIAGQRTRHGEGISTEHLPDEKGGLMGGINQITKRSYGSSEGAK